MNHNYFIAADDDYEVVIRDSESDSNSSYLSSNNYETESDSENTNSDVASTDSFNSVLSLEFDNIYLLEEDFADQDRYNGQYILGMSCSQSNRLFTDLFTAGVSTATFFRFPFASVLYYLYCSSVIYVHRPNIDIIQIYIDQRERYIAVKKTFWLRLVQRCWKKVYRERCDICNRRKQLASLRYREVYGKYPVGLRNLPTIYGMMWDRL